MKIAVSLPRTVDQSAITAPHNNAASSTQQRHPSKHNHHHPTLPAEILLLSLSLLTATQPDTFNHFLFYLW